MSDSEEQRVESMKVAYSVVILQDVFFLYSGMQVTLAASPRLRK